MPNKIVVAVTGASGSIYAKLLIEKLLLLQEQWQELSVVMSNNAKTIWQTELGNEDYNNYPVRYFDKYDFNAPFASGSAKYNVMIIAPCSMGTLGRIATGVSDDLVTRAADVILKERRKLIAMVRDTPYNLIHIKNMETVTLAGGIIAPAHAFFLQPANNGRTSGSNSCRPFNRSRRFGYQHVSLGQLNFFLLEFLFFSNGILTV